MLFKGEDAYRPLADRVERFCLRYTKKLTVLDTRSFALPGCSEELRALVSPKVLATVLEPGRRPTPASKRTAASGSRTDLTWSGSFARPPLSGRADFDQPHTLLCGGTRARPAALILKKPFLQGLVPQSGERFIASSRASCTSRQTRRLASASAGVRVRSCCSIVATSSGVHGRGSA